MKMVGNQTPSKQSHRQPFSCLLHQIEESGVVLLLVEHFLPCVAAIEHMVANTTHRCPCRSCHAPILSTPFTSYKRKSRMSPLYSPTGSELYATHRSRGSQWGYGYLSSLNRTCPVFFPRLSVLSSAKVVQLARGIGDGNGTIGGVVTSCCAITCVVTCYKDTRPLCSSPPLAGSTARRIGGERLFGPIRGWARVRM